MGRPNIMPAIHLDSIRFEGEGVYKFFNDRDIEISDPIATKLKEQKIVNWFFNKNDDLDSLFYGELRISKKYQPYLGVTKPIIKDSGKPGDIDILLINHKEPECSIAFQVKKVNSRIDDEGNVRLNKIEGRTNLPAGIIQAKESYNKYRFFKEYLMIVVVTNAKKSGNENILFRYPSEDGISAVYDFPGLGDLPESVGIFVLEIIQPTRQRIDHCCSIMSTEYRRAKPQDQLNETTEKVIEFLKREGEKNK